LKLDRSSLSPFALANSRHFALVSKTSNLANSVCSDWIFSRHRRDFVLPDDFQAVIRPTLRHRMVLEPGAEVEGMGPGDAIDELVRSVAVPH